MTDAHRPGATDLDFGSIPDHRERPTGAPTVSYVSDQGEVEATIKDGQVDQLRVNDAWLHATDADKAADVMTATINSALDQWQEAQLAKLESLLPDMKTLHGSIATLRQEEGDGWVRTLAERPQAE